MSRDRRRGDPEQLNHRELIAEIVRHPDFQKLVTGAATAKPSPSPTSPPHAPTPSDPSRESGSSRSTSVDAELASIWRHKTTVSGRKGKGKKVKTQIGRPSAGTFTKDIVLLPSADFKRVPSHPKRAQLTKDGFVLNLFEIDVQWDSITLIENLRQAFWDKLTASGNDGRYYCINFIFLLSYVAPIGILQT